MNGRRGFWATLFAPVGAYYRWAGHRQRLRNKVLAYVAPPAAILVVIMVASAGGGGGGGEDEEAIQVVATATSTDGQVAATVPPAATDQPGPPELSAAECDYLETVTAQSESLSRTLNRLVDLTGNPQFLSDDWRIDTAAQLATIRVIFDEAVALDPPQSLTAVHTEYTTGLSSFDLSTDLFARGVDNLDEDLISEAAAQMNLGSETIRSAADMMGEFSATRSGSCD